MKRESILLHPVSLDLVFRDPKTNLKLMREEIEKKISEKDHSSENIIFIFPELTLTGFVTVGPEKVSLKMNSPVVKEVRALAKEFKTNLIFGFPEASKGKPKNLLLFVDQNGKILAEYRKTHLFTQGNPSEEKTYARGKGGVILDFKGWRFGFGICFDLRFPRFFYEYAKKQVDCVILPACWVGGPNKSLQFETLSRAHAISLQMYFCSVNRIGDDPFFHYEGEKFLFEPSGIESKDFLLKQEVIEKARSTKVRDSDLTRYVVFKGKFSEKKGK